MFARSKKTSRSVRSTRRLELESLESRTMLSVTSAIRYGSFVRVDTNNASTHVEVRWSGGNIEVRDHTGAQSFFFNPAGLTRVGVYCGAGNDKVVNNVSSLALTAVGYGGNDYLEGYSMNDIFNGGDGNDTMVGYSGNDTFYGGNGNDVIKGMSGNDSAWGDAGNDLMIGGAGNDYLNGGIGHDNLVGGAGTDTCYGGTGNDTLVALDAGTTDKMYGQAGRDAFWVDRNPILWWFVRDTTDSAAGDTTHAVSSFANGADRTLDGDSIADPTDGTNYKNFSSKPLFSSFGPSANDVDQEALADCWLLAPLAAIARDNPTHIRHMVADFGDGTYGVKLGSKFYRVDADLPTWSAGSTDQMYAGLGQEDSLWVAIVEKAYAHFRTGANTFASLGWGDPEDAMVAYNTSAVGQSYFAAGSNSTTVANTVFSHWNAFQNTTICTGTVPGGSPLVASHCYSVHSVTKNISGQVISITLRNPWGPDNTGGNPFVVLTPAQLSACQLWVTWGNA